MPAKGFGVTGKSGVGGVSVTACTLSCECERFERSEGSVGCSGVRTRRRLEPCFVTGVASLGTIGCGPAVASA